MATTGRVAGKSAFIRIGDWFFKYRNLAFPAVLVALMIVFPPVPLLGDPARDWLLDLVGVTLCVIGSGLRIWVIGLAYIKRGGLNKKVHADSLVTDGMFGVCRNPLYVGNALVLAGILLVHGSPWVIGLGALYFGFAYAAIVAAEEHFLRAKFGAEYDAYCRTVNRFWPDFARYRAARRDMVFNWRRPLMKDYSSVYAWIAALLVQRAYERVDWGLLQATLPDLAPTLSALAVATAAMVLVRALKKSGLLTELPQG